MFFKIAGARAKNSCDRRIMNPRQGSSSQEEEGPERLTGSTLSRDLWG